MEAEREAIWRNRVQEAHLHHTREKSALLSALKQHFGPQVSEVVARTASARAFEEWRAIGEAQADRSAENLVRLLWEPLREKGFVFEATSAPDGLHIHCSHCPIAELAQAIGGQEWLFHLACGIDGAIAEGFNPGLGLRRKRTLMEGHACCDHLYFIKEECPSRPD
jgi:predicted ArsR family transcriptional regulator